MDIQLTSTGTPTKVVADVDQQLRQASAMNDGSWPTLASIRDYVAAKVTAFVDEHKVKESKEMTVSIALTVSISSTAEDADADGAQATGTKPAKRRTR